MSAAAVSRCRVVCVVGVEWVELLTDCGVTPSEWGQVVWAWDELDVDADEAADYVDLAAYDMTQALADAAIDAEDM